MRLSLTRLCLLSSARQWRRLIGRVMLVCILLPSLASAAPETLEPIKLRKTWLNAQPLEPIVLKKPASMIEAERLTTQPPMNQTLVDEAPASLAPVESAPVSESLTVADAPEEETLVDDEVVTAPPLEPEPTKAPNFNERIQSLADAPRERPSTLNVAQDTVLPATLASMVIMEENIETDDKTINKIIDIADQYADIPQLLLEVRGIAPMTATSAERDAAYKNAQLIMSGLVSAGIPYHRIAAFVMLLDAAPGSVRIIRTR